MKTSVKLPFELNPYLKTFHGTAYPLGILFSENQESYPWLMSSFTQLCWCDDLVNPFDFDTVWMVINEDFWELILYTLETPLFSSDDTEKFVLPYFKKMINNGFYVCGQYNEMYTPHSICYQRINYEHDFLIFGYDDENQQFDVATYDRTRHFTAHKLSYNDLTQALLHLKGTTFNGNIIRKKTDYILNFDLQKLTHDIHRYLNSTGSKPNSLYGQAVYQKLSEYICDNSIKSYNLRVFSIFQEHKKLLHMKSEYLLENKLISDTSIHSVLEKNENIASVMYALAMKYNIRPKEDLQNRINILLKEVQEAEIPALEKLLKEMEGTI